MRKILSNENKKILKSAVGRIIITIILGLVTSFLVNSLLRASLSDWDWSSLKEYLLTQETAIFWMETGVLFSIYLWFAFLLRSKWGTASLFFTVSVSVAIANNQKMNVRGEPIYPSDFDMVKALPELMGMVDNNLVIVSIVFVLVMLTITVLLMRKEWSIKRYTKNIAFRMISFLIFVVLSLSIINIYNFNESENNVRSYFDSHANWIDYAQVKNYKKNGFISGFLFNLPGPAVEKPYDISAETIEDIVLKYTKIAKKDNKFIKKENEINPNVIFVMNESFSDPENIEDINLSKYPIPFFKKLSKNNLDGNLLVSGYSGGTGNTEFQSLTNIAMEPLASNISIPYVQMSSQMVKTPNTVSYFKDRDYKTTAIHPYKTILYKRPDVYSALGFEEFIYDETMQSTKRYEDNKYISDYSSYEEILYQLKSTNQKNFIHLVTMHGHQPYDDNYSKLMFEIEGANNQDTGIIEQYYQGLSYSDQDLEYLVEGINQLDEETLLVFWGDHLPGVYTDEIFTKENMLDKYEPPVLFYSNFKDGNAVENMGTVSPFYFMNHISDILNHPVSGYTAFMKELENEISAFEKGMYVESKTQSILENRNELSTDAQEKLKEYDILLYDLFEGNQKAMDLGFYEIP